MAKQQPNGVDTPVARRLDKCRSSWAIHINSSVVNIHRTITKQLVHASRVTQTGEQHQLVAFALALKVHCRFFAIYRRPTILAYFNERRIRP